MAHEQLTDEAWDRQVREIVRVVLAQLEAVTDLPPFSAGDKRLIDHAVRFVDGAGDMYLDRFYRAEGLFALSDMVGETYFVFNTRQAIILHGVINVMMLSYLRFCDLRNLASLMRIAERIEPYPTL